jgi:hypothetical protein
LSLLFEEGLWNLRDREWAAQTGAVILEGRVPRVPLRLLCVRTFPHAKRVGVVELVPPSDWEIAWILGFGI